jgi:hypothetical protein
MTDNDALIDFVSSVSGETYLKVEETFGDGFVRLRISEAERRQAKHDIRSVEDVVIELLRNSRDAHAQRLFIATSREGDLRTLTIIDDGVGIPEAMHDRVFEPRVTSKLETMVMDNWGVHGRGMALYSIKENVASCRVIASEPHRGTSIAVTIDTTVLPERADQSTWPAVEPDETGRRRAVRGPHNIARRAVEFTCEHPGADVYLGSPAEILSTLCDLARGLLDNNELLFCDDASRLAVWQRPAACADAAELVSAASAIGLDVSERTAHRILAGEIPTLSSVAERCGDAPRIAVSPPEPSIYRDRRGLKVHAADLAAFGRELEQAFDTLADKYYINLKGEPKIVVGRDEIRVRFRLDKED